MIDRADLEQSIAEWESVPATYQSIEKLADLYTVYNHLFARPSEIVQCAEWYKGVETESEFLATAAKKNITEVMILMDELMESVQVLNSKLYAGVMQRLVELD